MNFILLKNVNCKAWMPFYDTESIVGCDFTDFDNGKNTEIPCNGTVVSTIIWNVLGQPNCSAIV